MADNFEQFKIYEETPPRLDKHHNSSLLRKCKSVILQLQTELNRILSQLQRKDQIIQQMLKQKDQLKTKQLNMENTLLELTRINKDKQLKLDTLNQEIAKYKEQISDQNSKINSLNRQIEAANKKSTQLESHNKKMSEIIQQLKQKIFVMKENIELTSQENYNLIETIQQKQEESMWEISQLRKLNQCLKKRFQLFEQQRIQDYEPDKKYSSPPSQQKYRKRAMSTDKKHNLYVNQNSTLKPTNEPYKILKNIIYTNRPVQRFNPNPQIGRQLENIKQQISRQYGKMEIKKQNFNHQRVHQTLAQLQKKIGKIVLEVQKTDSQSCID